MSADFKAVARVYTNGANGPFLGEVVVELPYYDIEFTVRITRDKSGTKHVSWPEREARAGRLCVRCTSGPDSRQAWDEWILQQFDERA